MVALLLACLCGCTRSANDNLLWQYSSENGIITSGKGRSPWDAIFRNRESGRLVIFLDFEGKSNTMEHVFVKGQRIRSTRWSGGSRLSEDIITNSNGRALYVSTSFSPDGRKMSEVVLPLEKDGSMPRIESIHHWGADGSIIDQDRTTGSTVRVTAPREP